MDLVLTMADHYVLTPYVYPASWPEDGALRQIISILLLMNLGGGVFYLGLGTINYYFIYDHDLMKHPHFLENQVHREIKYVMTTGIPGTCILFVAVFFAQVRGYSKLYDSVDDSPLGWSGLFLSLISFLFFSDMVTYWVHRFLHHQLLYKSFHKLHHIWKITTPFSSHTTHPVETFLLGLPYHIYPFLFPLHKGLYLSLYVFVNIWTISTHDGDYRIPSALSSVINSAAHHTDHHLFFNFNYALYFTLWDRLGGTYRQPSALMGKGPLDLIRKLQAEGKLVNDTAKVNGLAQRGASCKQE